MIDLKAADVPPNTGQALPSVEEFLEKHKRGVLDDRPEGFAPLDAYGPPGEDELAEEELGATAARDGANGRPARRKGSPGRGTAEARRG